MLRKTSVISLIFILFSFIQSGRASGLHTPKPGNSVRFTENKNQWDSKILYRAQLDGGLLFLEKDAFTYNFYDKETLRKNHSKTTISKNKHAPIASHAFRMSFSGSNPDVKTRAAEPTPDYCNFFLGNDESKWASNVKNYTEVVYEQLYSGINLQILRLQNSLKYNFYVAAGSDPSQINLLYEGLDRITLDKGALRLRTSINEIYEQKPYAYQLINGAEVEVKCEFVLKNNNVSFRFPKGYDKDYELVIDPILVFACSSGSTADNFGMTATYDAIGNLYAGGTCFDIGYPVTTGAFDLTYNGVVLFGRTDVVITKFDSSGTFLQYSTYLGGAGNTEVVSSLIVNNANELMCLGATGSSDFPVTATAYDQTFNGGTFLSFPSNGTEYANGTDMYVTKFNAAGTALVGSTFVGGSGNDGANESTTLVYNYGDYYRGEIQVDNAGNCYVASCSESSNFPTTAGSIQPGLGGGLDGVVFKLNSNLSAMLWSTYLGGSADDACYALTIDNSSNVYATGGTSSANFVTTAGALSTVYNGGISDGFVTKIQNTGSTVLSSTFIGTAFYDQSYLIQLDNNNDVYLVGQTEGNMPVTPGTYSNPNSKQFMWQLNNNLSTQLITTVFGNGSGQVNISPSAFLVDTCGNIYVCGWGGNILTGVPTTGMPISPGAYQPTTDGFNFYLMVLLPDATGLLYATYFGGPVSAEHVDGGTSRFDKKGIVYQAVCSGCGGNDDFPVTPGSWPNTGANVNHAFNCNIGVFKFDFQAAGVNADASFSPNDTICVGSSVAFNNSSANAFNYIWDFGDGSPQETITEPTHIFTSTGTFTVTLIAFDSTGCIFSDTTLLDIVVLPLPVVNIGNDTMLCSSPSLLLNAGNSGLMYNWSTGASTQTITATTMGTFWVTVSNNVCADSDTMEIILFTAPVLIPDTTLCAGQPVTLTVPPIPGSYLWSTGDTSLSITVSSAGSYWVQASSGPCTGSDTVVVNYLSYPIVNLPANSLVCPDDSVLLDAGSPGTAYLWSTGDTSQTIYADTTGTFYVTVFNQQCSTSDTANVVEIIFAPEITDTILCAGQTISLNAFVAGGSYLWSTGASTSSITVATPGLYWVTVTVGPCSVFDSATISYVQYPVISLPPAVDLCPNSTIVLDPGSGAMTYLWSTTQTSQAIDVGTGGTYVVTASNASCSVSDTTIVNAIPPIAWEEEVLLCNVEKYTLDAGIAGSSYLWSTGETTQTIDVSQEGYYWVTMFTAQCTISDTILATGTVGSGILWFPNSFTPNTNGLNDVFAPKGVDLTEYHLMIFDRWGEKIYESERLEQGWDGTFKGELVKQDVYVWRVKYKTKCKGDELLKRVGHVTVVR
ncbi:MAG: gliding motility-associated C-terminal domain-containing protein [Bacteroidota bacterium]|nr:gliding motility-associated C-terminal domain-containing protein [Bacteroidota bacterium]